MMTRNMQKIIRYLISTILILQILAMALSPILKVAAQPYYIGVEVGDYFTYGNFRQYITPANAPPISEWQMFANMSIVNFTITENPNPTPGIDEIIFRQRLVFSNGTSTRMLDGGIDLAAGVGEGYLFFVYAGLEKGDRIYPQSKNYTYTINETRKDPYWGGRDTCLLNQTAIWWKQTILFYSSTIVEWDKVTGVILRLQGSTAGYGGQTTIVIEGGTRFELIATNRFPIGRSSLGEMLPLYIIVAAVLVIALIVVIVRATTSAPKKKWKKLKE